MAMESNAFDSPSPRCNINPSPPASDEEDAITVVLCLRLVVVVVVVVVTLLFVAAQPTRCSSFTDTSTYYPERARGVK